MITRFALYLLACVSGIGAFSDLSNATPAPDDPLKSFMWEEMHKRLLGGDPFQFDQRVKVIAPTDAEDPMNVPVLVDASALGSVRRIVVFAELNPIQKILEMEPLRAEARVGIRIKVQQATPVRAAALTEDGVWHVGGQIVEAAGGGCTAPSVGSANADWASRLGEVTGRLWQRPDGTRVRLRIMHPMDTGLGGGIPAFYIEELALEDSDGEVLTRLAMFEPVAENPVLTIDLPKTDHVALQARDNNGNPVFARILAGDKGR